MRSSQENQNNRKIKGYLPWLTEETKKSKDVYEVQYFEIPKKNGKTRRIVQGNPALKKLHKNFLPSIRKIFDKECEHFDLQDTIFGFVKGENVVSCAMKHVGYECTTTVDIKDFFDNCTASKFKREVHHYENLSKYFPWVLCITDELGDFGEYDSRAYCAQGFSTSPIMCCVLSVSLMKKLETELKKLPFETVSTIYADDIQISYNNDSPEDVKLVTHAVYKVIEDFGFEVNRSKTRTRFLKYGYKRILGINVGKDGVRCTRKILRKIRSAKHQNNKESLGGLVQWSKCRLPFSKEP